jgi:signal transduction histidine kinase
VTTVAETPSLNLEQLLLQRESLRQVVESISSELELRPLLNLIVRHACELIGADNGTIGLVDEARQVIRTEAAYRMPVSEIGAEMLPGVGLAGQILLTRQPVILSRYDAVNQPTIAGLEAYAVIGLPILWGRRLIGFFGIGAAPPRRFTEPDLEMLTTFARHAAIAIENARLFEAEKQRSARMAIINQVSQLIASSLNLDQLLQTTVEAIARRLSYHNVALLLLDPADPTTLVLRARSGLYNLPEIGDYRQNVQHGIIGAAVQIGHYLLINDVQRDPRYMPIPQVNTIVAELAVPIIMGERLLGVLNIEAEQALSEDDAAGFEIIADQLAVALEHARLFAETQKTLEETRLLYQTSQWISTAMDVAEVIQAYLAQVAARGRYACNVVLYEYDDLGRRSTVLLCGRWTPQQGLMRLAERIPYNRDALDPPLDAGQTITIADVRTDPRVPPGLREMQAQAGRPALALIPLMVQAQRIGLVVLSDAVANSWPADELQPYQTTAAQLATAIDSRRQQHLLAERGQQLAVLKERQRLARDLHDSVTQLIFSMTLIAQSVGPAWRRDPTEGERRVQRLLELSQSALAEMRALLAELRPPEPAQLPLAAAQTQPDVTQPISFQGHLVAAIQNYITQINQGGLLVRLHSSDYQRQWPAHEEAFYRIAQEALNNVVKHAQANRVTINLGLAISTACLIVQDDGLGFSAAPISHSGAGGLGLITMRERAEALGGSTRLVSASGQGTTVTVTLPRRDYKE